MLAERFAVDLVPTGIVPQSPTEPTRIESGPSAVVTGESHTLSKQSVHS